MQEPVDADRLLDAADAILACDGRGRRHPVKRLIGPDRPPHLRRFTVPEIESAVVFLMRLGFVELA